MLDDPTHILSIQSSGDVGIGAYEEILKDASGPWTHVRVGGNTYPRAWVAVAGKSFMGVLRETDRVVVAIPRTRWIKDAAAIAELRALLVRWRANGRGDVADQVEFAPGDGDIWAYLGHGEPDTPEIRHYALEGCVFIQRSIRTPSVPLHIRASGEAE